MGAPEGLLRPELNGHGRRRGTPEECLRAFEASQVARGFSELTIGNAAGTLARFLAACGRPAWEVTREDVDRVVGELAAQGLAMPAVAHPKLRVPDIYAVQPEAVEHAAPLPVTSWSTPGPRSRKTRAEARAASSKARQRLVLLPAEARQRVTLLQADGEHAGEAVGGELFAGVLCHGVLGYLEDPEPLVAQLCQRADAGGIVSIMTANAHATAVQPALERRWSDALASFDARTGIGVLGVRGRSDTVEELCELIRRHGVEPERWYGTWLFVDWLKFGGTTLDSSDTNEVEAIAAVELEASRRDPYRQVSRAFHLIGRKGTS